MSTRKPMIDKEDSRRIRRQIRQVLLKVWDPIGVKDEPNAQDEYDRYVGEIYELLVSKCTEAELAAHLYWIAHEQMGFNAATASDTQPTVAALRAISFDLAKWI